MLNDKFDTLNIHNYLMVKNNIKLMSKIIKRVFIISLIFSWSFVSIDNTLGHTKCISLNNLQCMAGPTLINLNLNKHTEGLLSKLNKDLNFSVFSMIAGLNESKIFTKHISCKCKCKFDCGKFNSNQKWIIKRSY